MSSCSLCSPSQSPHHVRCILEWSSRKFLQVWVHKNKSIYFWFKTAIISQFTTITWMKTLNNDSPKQYGFQSHTGGEQTMFVQLSSGECLLCAYRKFLLVAELKPQTQHVQESMWFPVFAVWRTRSTNDQSVCCLLGLLTSNILQSTTWHCARYLTRCALSIILCVTSLMPLPLIIKHSSPRMHCGIRCIPGYRSFRVAKQTFTLFAFCFLTN